MSGTIGNLFGSKGARAESSTPTGFQSLPQFGQDAYKEAVGRATTASNNPTLFAPTGFNADQTRSFDMAREGYIPINSQTFGENLSVFTNPFEEQVIQGMNQDIRREGQGIFSDIGAGATAAGGFGGTRQAVLEAENARNILDTIAQVNAQERSKNFQSAADRALGAIGTNNTLKQQQMSDLGTAGAAQQSLATQQSQAPLEAIKFLLASAQGLPTGGGGVNLGAQDDQGFLGRLSTIASNFGSAAKGFI